MSVASKNPFAILVDDDGPTPPATEPLQPSTNQPSTRGGQRGGRGNRGGPGVKGGKYYPRGGARTSAPREGAEDDGADDSTGKKVEFVERDRGRGRGRGGRGRGDRGGPRGEGRRTYDRHSATGKTDSEKKIHQSWGGDEGQTELATETAAANDAAVEQTAPAENWEPSGGGDTEWGAAAGNTEWGAEGGNTEWGAEAGNTDWAASAPVPTSTANAEEPAERSDRRPRDRQEEEPDNTLTLDQYLAQQKEKSPIVPQLETRKIEQDESLWKGAKELVKGAEEDTYFVGKTKSTPKSRTKKEEKVYLEIEARFERPDRGRGRGGRGGGGDRGGGRERNQRRDGRSNGGTNALNVADETAFPSLS